jgi:hypothetical protein
MHDDVIMRTIIDLSSEQIEALAEWCEAERISRAEAVRRSLDEVLARRRLRRREEVFGSWSPRGDSRQIVDDLRKEWEG